MFDKIRARLREQEDQKIKMTVDLATVEALSLLESLDSVERDKLLHALVTGCLAEIPAPHGQKDFLSHAMQSAGLPGISA
jgi:hypothetical protein